MTASVRGHSIYVFQICPPDGRGAKGGLRMGSAVRLFRSALEPAFGCQLSEPGLNVSKAWPSTVHV